MQVHSFCLMHRILNVMLSRDGKDCTRDILCLHGGYSFLWETESGRYKSRIQQHVSKNLRATNQLWRQEMMGIQWDKSQEVGQNVEVLSWFLRPTGDGE